MVGLKCCSYYAFSISKEKSSDNILFFLLFAKKLDFWMAITIFQYFFLKSITDNGKKF